MQDKDTLDFIIIGAQKSGTSSLFQYLRHHPEIFLPVDKEVPYFSHDTAVETIPWRTYLDNISRNVGRNIDRQTADPALKWGTATPHYTVGGVWETTPEAAEKNRYDERTVPLRIHERLPDVRLVAILRDPVARAVSHHRVIVRLGRERRTFDEAAEELLDPQSLEHARRHPDQRTGYVTWGEYGRILEGYFDVFPSEQILVVFTEELERAPVELLSRIQQFIGVRSDFEPENLGVKYNEGAVERGFSWTSPSSWMSPSSPVSPQGVRRALSRNRGARAVWQLIPADRQRQLKRPHERFAGRVARWNRRKPPNVLRANAEPSPATLARLREHYAHDGDRLAALIGVQPPWHASAEAEIAGH
jgi:Sulfotransferase domain